MGSAATYTCQNCGYTAEWVTADFDCGFSGDVVTPIACPKDGIRQAMTGLKAWDDDWRDRRRDSYECPECHEERPLWDRKTCPLCGQSTMDGNESNVIIMWD
jgi:hypothetical protein